MSSSPRVCPRCGTPIEEERFCSTCGLNLYAQTELPSAESYAATPPPHSSAAQGPVGARPNRSAQEVATAAADAPRADWWPRGGALIIDNLILWVPSLLLVGLLNYLGIVLALGLTFAYGLLMTRDEQNGQTWGMEVTKVRVRRTDGKPVDTGTDAMRWLLMQNVVFGLLSAFVFFIPTILNYLWPLWDEERRALHDMVASTRVVNAL
jgi:uncharacterized RDD family membrane protein YckC